MARRGSAQAHPGPPSPACEASAQGEIRCRFAASSCAGSRIAFHFASLRYRLPGKARLMVWAQLSPLLSRAHAAKAECDPGPSARLRREAAPNSFRRGLLTQGARAEPKRALA